MKTLTSEKQVQIKETGRQPIIFRQGLPGFGNNREYNLFPLDGNPYFYFLQSVKEQELGLILTDPFFCFPDYSVDLTEEELAELELIEREDILVMTTVTFAGDKNMTTNLAAPIIINIKKRLARQIVIPEKIGEMRTPLEIIHRK